ncbi:hypothetical protein QYE76_052153 [Lolium multiflorum]|uniref:Uncharacterized protein n=1 Tax=Lolium multiflorum TaxID=4521 RepID=A0AAD8SU87_LOLMU|nr:hypothetical protein QYE76_052153 [Lolium multiflorum]
MSSSDKKIVNPKNKDAADVMTWREYEALRNEMRREFRTQDDELRGTVQEISQKLDSTNETVTKMQDQMTDIQRSLQVLTIAVDNLAQQQQPEDEDLELQDEALGVGRGVGRGNRGRGFFELGARRVPPQQQDDCLGKPKFSIPKFEGGADVEEYLTWELKIEKLCRLHDYTEDRKEFSDVFPEEVPAGLPPLRGIEHQIDLIPGASLPNRAPYRTNPEETKEIASTSATRQRQFQQMASVELARKCSEVSADGEQGKAADGNQGKETDGHNVSDKNETAESEDMVTDLADKLSNIEAEMHALEEEYQKDLLDHKQVCQELADVQAKRALIEGCDG